MNIVDLTAKIDQKTLSNIGLQCNDVMVTKYFKKNC